MRKMGGRHVTREVTHRVLQVRAILAGVGAGRTPPDGAAPPLPTTLVRSAVSAASEPNVVSVASQ